MSLEAQLKKIAATVIASDGDMPADGIVVISAGDGVVGTVKVDETPMVVTPVAD